MAPFKGKSPALASSARGANGKGKGKAAASILQGYPSNFDSDARISAGNTGRRKRTFFSASMAGLPPLIPFNGISPSGTNGATNGKASVGAKQTGVKSGSGGKNGDGKRSRRESPMSVA